MLINEDGIRDLLASNLSILEDGLQLLKIEQYIPSTLGTRSFLDILAKDRAGHWVIIEVKKNNATAREAAHEVFKYVEAVQRHFGARNNEVRAIIASTEWKELLVPFSKIRAESNIAIEGVHLVLANQDTCLKASPVEPITLTQGRYIAPWHELNVYHDKSSLQRGIESYDQCCQTKGIQNYVLVVLKAAEDFNERAAATVAAALQALKGEYAINNTNSTLPQNYDLERFEYILYFAPQMLTREFCLDVIASEPDQLEEAKELRRDVGELAEICFLHESVYDASPRPFRDHLEIGYAAKFGQKLLIDEGWSVERVLRRGLFERNVLLNDKAIIEELQGLTGSSGQVFKRSISLANRAHISSARDDLAAALDKNPAWLSQVFRIFDTIHKDMPNGYVNINLFNPSSGVFTLYFMASEEDSISYMPRYEVALTDNTEKLFRIYIGLLAPSGKAMSLNEIITKYYNGRVGNLMFLASTGFYETRDTDILDDLGLVYKTFRLDDPHGNQQWFELKDDRWKRFTPPTPFQPLQPYFDKNTALLKSIVNTIGSRMHSGFHDMS